MAYGNHISSLYISLKILSQMINCSLLNYCLLLSQPGRSSYYYTSLSLFKNLLPPGTQNSANFLMVMTAAPLSVLARHRWILKVVTEDV